MGRAEANIILSGKSGVTLRGRHRLRSTLGRSAQRWRCAPGKTLRYEVMSPALLYTITRVGGGDRDGGGAKANSAPFSCRSFNCRLLLFSAKRKGDPLRCGADGEPLRAVKGSVSRAPSETLGVCPAVCCVKSPRNKIPAAAYIGYTCRSDAGLRIGQANAPGADYCRSES